MKSTTLIIPGLHDSGPDHWQTWFESQVNGSVRVTQANWANPAIDRWSDRVREAIDAAVGQVWLVAHSFGCLAAVTAAVNRADRVAGALLVAPANPERFLAQDAPQTSPSLAGDLLSTQLHALNATITPVIPHEALGFPAVVVASSNDPWMRLTAASVWADRWGAQFECIGRAGHINVESGFGPWPKGFDLFERFRKAHGGDPLGAIDTLSARSGGRRKPHLLLNAHDAHTQRGERMLDQQWIG